MTPLSAHLDERHAYVGRAGYGKTNGARVGVEELLTRTTARVCIIDPTDAWWGLRESADGKSPAHPIVIFGGDYGDLPLTESAGETIGLAVARSSQSCIVSLANFLGENARRRFAAEFLSALYEHNREPLHLIVDEADTLAPQTPGKEIANAIVLARMQAIVRRGRIRGFVPWLITQRPAVLNKDVLSQADVLVAFNLTSSQDREAIGAWIEGQADKAQEKAILASLPKLKRGSALIWAPGADRLDMAVQFPLTATYDSGRTPKAGEKRHKLSPIDVGALRDQIATVEAEVQQKDPARLRAEITRLEARNEELVAQMQRDRRPRAAELATAFAKGRTATIEVAVETCQQLVTGLRARLEDAALFQPDLAPADELRAEMGKSRPPEKPANLHVPRPPRTNGGQNPEKSSTLGPPDRRILTALAQYHPTPLPRERLAAICGYAPDGGGFGNRLSKLRTAGLIETGPPPHAITAKGLAELGPFTRLPTGKLLRVYWQQRVPKAAREILNALAAEGGIAQRSAIAERAGYNAQGGGFTNSISRLRTLGLVTGSRMLKLADDLRGH